MCISLFIGFLAGRISLLQKPVQGMISTLGFQVLVLVLILVSEVIHILGLILDGLIRTLMRSLNNPQILHIDVEISGSLSTSWRSSI